MTHATLAQEVRVLSVTSGAAGGGLGSQDQACLPPPEEVLSSMRQLLAWLLPREVAPATFIFGLLIHKRTRLSFTIFFPFGVMKFCCRCLLPSWLGLFLSYLGFVRLLWILPTSYPNIPSMNPLPGSGKATVFFLWILYPTTLQVFIMDSSLQTGPCRLQTRTIWFLPSLLVL